MAIRLPGIKEWDTRKAIFTEYIVAILDLPETVYSQDTDTSDPSTDEWPLH